MPYLYQKRYWTIPEGEHLTKNLTAEYSKLAIFRRFLAVVGPSSPMRGERQKPYQKMQKNKRTAALGSFLLPWEDSLSSLNDT